MFTKIKSFLRLKSLIVLFTAIIVLQSSYFLIVHAMVIKNRGYDPGQPGYQFVDFKEHLKGIERVGYLTNKDISAEKNDGFFLMAQYFLAPTIIEVGNADLEYTIIDSLNPTYIVKTIIRLNATRVTNNEYGQGLFRRKKE